MLVGGDRRILAADKSVKKKTTFPRVFQEGNVRTKRGKKYIFQRRGNGGGYLQIFYGEKKNTLTDIYYIEATHS